MTLNPLDLVRKAEPSPTPAVYTFTSWNPSGTGSVSTNPAAGVDSSTNPDVTTSFLSGTLTLTFNRIGYYLITTSVNHTHNTGYAGAQFSVTVGGTATRTALLTAQVEMAIGIAAQDNNINDSYVFVAQATAVNQTVTIVPAFVTSTLVGVVADHTARAAVIVQSL